MKLGGVIKVLLGGGLFLLWWRGYTTDLLTAAGARLQTPPARVPFGPPGQGIPALTPQGR